jgi:hypothetical protein
MEINNVPVRLTAEPDELRTTPSGKQVVSFGVAYNVTVQVVAGIQTFPLVSSVRTSNGRRPCLAAVDR